MAKKLLSIILTLCMVTGLFAGVTFNVSAAGDLLGTETFSDLTVTHHTSGVPNENDYKAVKANVAEGSVVLNDATKTGDKLRIVNVTRNEETGEINEADSITSTSYQEKAIKAFTGTPYVNTADMTFPTDKIEDVTIYQGRNDEGYYTRTSATDITMREGIENTNENFLRKTYYQSNLGKEHNISDVIVGSAGAAYRTGYYTILTSTDGVNWTQHYAYAADRKVNGETAVNSGLQLLKFTTPVKAQYVRIEIYANINTVAQTNLDSNIRIKCFQVFGYSEYALTATNPTSTSVVPADFNGEKNLIQDKLPEAELTKYYNKTERTTEYNSSTYTLEATEEPAVLSYFTGNTNGLKFLTKADNTNTDVCVYYAGKYTYNMFITNDGTKVTGLIDDEDEQWVQLTYKLDGLSSINRFFVGANKATSLHNGMPSHYKVIFSETAEGVYDESKASKVIEVNMAEDENARANLHNHTMGTPVKARYVGFKIICAHNDFAASPATDNRLLSHNPYFRMTHFGVYGSYDAPVTTDVTAKAVDADGADVEIDTTATATNAGVEDENDNYGMASVALVAEESKTIGDYEYTFEGWYNGDEKVLDTAKGNVIIEGADAVVFTAKYAATQLAKKYTITFVDATKTVVAEIKVEEGQYIDMALVNAIEVKDIYGYTVSRDADTNYVDWDKDFDDKVTADMTCTALYNPIETLKIPVKVYDVSGTVLKDDNPRYDTAFNLVSTEGAKYWADANGDVILAAETGVLYACGESMEIYAKADELTDVPAIRFIGKDNNADSGFTVFAHVNIENAVKYGAVFSNNTGYIINNNFGVEDTKSENASYYQMIEVDVDDAAKVDFMCTLNYNPLNPNPKRWVRAYVVVDNGNGEEIYYTEAICNK